MPKRCRSSSWSMPTALIAICLLFGGKVRLSPIRQVNAAADVAVGQSSTGAPHYSYESPGQLSKFETYGPTMTVVLRDLTMSLRSKRPLIARSKSLVSNEIPMSFEGLAAKLAARFRISSESSASIEPPQTPTQFANGYMLDSGKIMLGPSRSRYDESTKQFFPALGGQGSIMRWSDCIMNIQPELAYEVRSRDNVVDQEDSRPFPRSLPWLNAVSCGLKWRPFPTYKPREGYGHKLMSAPHYARCGTSICLPRVFGIRKRRADIALTYHDDSTRNGGTIEVLLGKSGSCWQPQCIDQNIHRQRNNHILACFSRGKNDGRSTFEYVRGSLYLPLPSFLHKSSKGVSVSPSFDFVDNKPRLVVSGDVGVRGRTSAVLRLDSDDSTLTVVRALDERRIIAPTISLQTGKIVYDWHVGLDNKSSVRAHVDPTKGIRVMWTDFIPGRSSEGNCWITEIELPLGVSAPGSRIGDIRVGRRWVI
ncbi:hypothetical protein ACHAXN_013511 [Cyclotella atomus]